MDARLRILETLYRFDLDEPDHIALIQDTASRYWETRRSVAVLSARTRSDGTIAWAPFQVTRENRLDYAEAASGVLQHIPDSEMRQYLSAFSFYGGSMEAGREGALHNDSTVQLGNSVGIIDVLGFCCGTGEGGLAGIVAFSDKPLATSQRERAHWRPIASHLATDLTEAVFSPDGRCLAALRANIRGPVLARLRDFVRTREMERNPRATSAGIWTELIDGHWTLIDNFESNGRRVVLALRNDAKAKSLCRLTPREAEVLSRARAGVSNKEISMDMGIPPSSVTRLLQSVALKLNASIAEVIRFAPCGDARYCLVCDESILSCSHDVDTSRVQDVLSAAECEVVVAALRGLSNQQIAVARGRSVRTIVNQLASAYEKVGARSRRELMSRLAGPAVATPGKS